jgi:hypothetical protein
MDKLMEIINQRCSPGVILFDLQGSLQYINQEACEIIPSLDRGGEREETRRSPLPAKLVEFIGEMVRKPLPDDPFQEPFLAARAVPTRR